MAYILYLMAFNFGVYAPSLDYAWPASFFILILILLVPVEVRPSSLVLCHSDILPQGVLHRARVQAVQ